MALSVKFHLDEKRVDRLSKVGLMSLRDLVRTLAALDMKATVEIEEIPLWLRPSEPAAPAAKED